MLVFALFTTLAQASPPPNYAAGPEIVLLGRAKAKMSDSLGRMPNYTCLQTIERSKRLAKRRKFELIDVLRLEVGLVDGKELFAWPGSGKFEDKELADMVPGGGAIGNGSFASHATSIFRGRAASIAFEAWEENPKRAKYAYRVPQNLSGYTIRSGRNLEATVGYHGAFWVEPESERVTRVEVEADDIPAFLEVSATKASIDYASVRIGDADYWLPVASGMMIADLNLSEFRNEIRFSGCRQFAGESSLRFDDPSDTPAAAAPPKEEVIALPKDLYFTIQLEDPLAWGKTVTGDKVRATLSGAIKHKGVVLFPKGAQVEGRVINLQTMKEGQYMDLEFETIVDGHRRAPFRATSMERRPSDAPVTLRGAPSRTLDRAIYRGTKPGAVTVVTFQGKTDLPKHFHLNWTTVE